MIDFTTEEDIKKLSGLTFDQLLEQMIEHADAVRVGADRFIEGTAVTADEQRLKGISSFMKSLAGRLSREFKLGQQAAIKAARAAVDIEKLKKRGVSFINLPEEDQAAQTAGLKDVIRKLTSMLEAHFEQVREQDQRITADVIAELRKIAESFRYQV